MKSENLSPAEKIQFEIYAKMTDAQKWQVFLSLRQTAWDLKAAGVQIQHPDWSSSRVQEEVRRIFLYATT